MKSKKRQRRRSSSPTRNDESDACERSTLAVRDRKTLQLCKQVERILNLLISGEFDDDILVNLVVESVQPAPNASQLLVTVSSFAEGELHPIVILQRLHAVAGLLRSEVAASISRKRAPQLLFTYGCFSLR